MTSPAGLLISPIVPLTILVTSEKLKFQKENPTFENMRNNLGGGLTFVEVFRLAFLLSYSVHGSVYVHYVCMYVCSKEIFGKNP